MPAHFKAVASLPCEIALSNSSITSTQLNGFPRTVNRFLTIYVIIPAANSGAAELAGIEDWSRATVSGNLIYEQFKTLPHFVENSNKYTNSKQRRTYPHYSVRVGPM